VKPGPGGELSGELCSCHNFTGQGGALSSESSPTELTPATGEDQIYTAMLSGPQNMPHFSDRSCRRREKTSSRTQDGRGGQNDPGERAREIGRCPKPDAWIVGIVALSASRCGWDGRQ